jgi:hypothetical protein
MTDWLCSRRAGNGVEVNFGVEYDPRYLFKTGEEWIPEYTAPDGAGISFGVCFLQIYHADGAWAQ